MEGKIESLLKLVEEKDECIKDQALLVEDLTFEVNEAKQWAANADLENLEISWLQKDL